MLTVNKNEILIPLDRFSFNKDEAEISVRSHDQTLLLREKFPFSIAKVPDKIFDVNLDISEILIFRNNSFSEKTVIKLKYNSRDIGFVFSLRGILDSEEVIDPKVIPYAVRALIVLMFNRASLPAKTGEFIHNDIYRVFDFYEEDIIICAISKEQFTYSTPLKTSILLQLNFLGFYLLQQAEFRSFIPQVNIFQVAALDNILYNRTTATLSIKELNKTVLDEPYFLTYITSLVSRTQAPIAKFLLIYQCFEILIDLVSKKEIQSNLCNNQTFDKSGFQIRELAIKIGQESYRINKLFDHYCSFERDSAYNVSYEIHKFFELSRDNYVATKEQSYGSYFYELRNILVHNLRSLYPSDKNKLEKVQNEFEKLVTLIEFLTIETLIGFKL